MKAVRSNKQKYEKRKYFYLIIHYRNQPVFVLTEHDHGDGADGRRHPGGGGDRRHHATNTGTSAARQAGRYWFIYRR